LNGINQLSSRWAWLKGQNHWIHYWRRNVQNCEHFSTASLHSESWFRLNNHNLQPMVDAILVPSLSQQAKAPKNSRPWPGNFADL
jgi:hypothetical protein